MDKCPKCDSEMTPEQAAQYHGCCSQGCDEDEGIMIIVNLPAPTEG